MAEGAAIELELLPDYQELPPFDESAPTFAENSAGKALHYSQFAKALVLADDSGLVVAALGGAPGVQSARYAGPHAHRRGSHAKTVEGNGRDTRRPASRTIRLRHFAGAAKDAPLPSYRISPRAWSASNRKGSSGFGYDPIFFSPELGRTFAESSEDGKNASAIAARPFARCWISSKGRNFSDSFPNLQHLRYVFGNPCARKLCGRGGSGLILRGDLWQVPKRQ